MTIDTQEQLDRLMKVGAVVATVCRMMGSRLEPGMTTKELDDLGRAALEKEGCRPAPALMYRLSRCHLHQASIMRSRMASRTTPESSRAIW
jgi:methionine aminopeptidase, type I (EC 3.4.11.18)